jgi:hypothetical protein
VTDRIVVLGDAEPRLRYGHSSHDKSLKGGERIQVENFSTSESSLDAEVLGGFVCPPELAFEPRKPLTAGSATARCKEWSRTSRIDWNNAWSAGTGTRSSTRRRRPRATVDWAWKLPRLLWQRRLPEALPPCQNGIRLSYQFSRLGDGP